MVQPVTKPVPEELVDALDKFFKAIRERDVAYLTGLFSGSIPGMISLTSIAEHSAIKWYEDKFQWEILEQDENKALVRVTFDSIDPELQILLSWELHHRKHSISWVLVGAR